MSRAAAALIGAALVAFAGLREPVRPMAAAGYRAAADAPPVATVRPAGHDSIAARLRIGWRSAGSRQGLLSIGGLPPTPGTMTVSGGALVFRPADGTAAVAYPLFRLVPRQGGIARRAAVSILEVDRSSRDAVYVLHLDGGVLETASPGILEQLATDPDRVDSLGDAWASDAVALADSRDTSAQLALIHELASSGYADSMFRLFGSPTRAIGLVGERGQRAGRLGEFMGSRDSVSLSPARMTNGAQLRHALAHELAHRWQRAAPDEVAALWVGIPAIRDSLRYGYGNDNEHQAEAVAFAVHFLQTSAAADLPADAALDLLGAYERLVPGTRAMARRLIAQPIYRYHPLAGTLLAPAPWLNATRRQIDTPDTD